jgi:hypothetical protein
MNEPFLPLTPTAASGQNRTDFRVSIVSHAENLRPFQPLGQTGARTGAAGLCEPRVTLQRDGDRVASIRIHCGCGQVIELACVYETVPEKDVPGK